jgi:hypothetical protein
METVSEPERVHESANKHLRRSVLSANPRHQSTAALWIQPIHIAATESQLWALRLRVPLPVGRLLTDRVTETLSRSSFWRSKASLACEDLSQARAHGLQ